MNELLVVLLSLSVSASLIALLLFALKPLYRNRLSRTWQYYVWLLVVVRLLLPFAPETNLMEYVFNRPAASVSHIVSQPEQAVQEFPALQEGTGAEAADAAQSAPSSPPTLTLGAFLREHLLTIWLVVALVLFVRKLTSYLSFVRYIRAGRREIDSPETLDAYFTACEDTGVKKPLPLYENKLASSPMLVGILRPYIVLPELALNTGSRHMILLHELTHYKRRDILYKWLVQLALCVHWFNPLIYLVSREIDHSCELSCDEAVMRRLEEGERRRYGDTLLATIHTGGGYGGTVAAITMSEDGRNLKERLEAILRHHSNSIISRAAAVVLSVVLLCGATFAGAYAGVRQTPANETSIQQIHTVAATAREPDVVVEEVSPPVILQESEYTAIVSVPQGYTKSVPLQTVGTETSLYVIQDGVGEISLVVRGADGSEMMDRHVSFPDQTNPIVQFDHADGALCSLEVGVAADGPQNAVIYGAGAVRGDRSTQYVLTGFPDLIGAITEGLASEVSDRIMEETASSIDRWAETGERWSESWSSQDWGNNGESWSSLDYEYKDGYLVGAGVRNNNTANWLLTSITVGGAEYPLSYASDAAQYKDNETVKSIVAGIIADQVATNKGAADRQFSVRTVIYNNDPEVLLRDLYKQKDLLGFMVVLEHCKGKSVIEELLQVAADEGSEVFFMYLAEQLPKNFDAQKAEALARQAAEDGHMVILSALEPFLSATLYESLMHELLDIDSGIDFGGLQLDR